MLLFKVVQIQGAVVSQLSDGILILVTEKILQHLWYKVGHVHVRAPRACARACVPCACVWLKNPPAPMERSWACVHVCARARADVCVCADVGHVCVCVHACVRMYVYVLMYVSAQPCA